MQKMYVMGEGGCYWCWIKWLELFKNKSKWHESL